MNNSLSPEEPQTTARRWDPVGASSDSEEDLERLAKNCTNERCHHYEQLKKLRNLEEEQELLNSSLFALTTHFAQVQFRLRQVVDAPTEDKDELLKSVEEFAFRGTPDVGLARERQDETNLAEIMRGRREQQQKLLRKLKAQLRQLEKCALESGSKISMSQKRQRKHEMGINLVLDKQGYYRLTPNDLQQQIDIAMSELANRLQMKELLTDQLKIQIDDLESFIYYLQAEMKKVGCICDCALHSVNKKKPPPKLETTGIIQKIALMLQMFAMLYLGCRPNHFKKRNITVNHWGDLSAYLEIAIAKVKETIGAMTIKQKASEQDDYLKRTKSSPKVCNVKGGTKVVLY